MDETDVAEVPPFLATTTEVDIGIEGVRLIHFPGEYRIADGLPYDGSWSVTWMNHNIALQRVQFRTLHAAAHHAFRLKALPGVLERIAEVANTSTDEKIAEPLGKEIGRAMAHAEAHAHEADAAWPAHTIIPFENGPSIVDDTGTERLFLMQAPLLSTERRDDGLTYCKDCGEQTWHFYES